MSYIEKIKKQKEEIAKIEKVLELYPDIKENVDRWSNKKLSSLSINSETDQIYIDYNCGCCEDSPLQVWPYKKVKGIKVFSNPACFMVGEKNEWGSGDIEYDGWQDKLRKENITEIVINKIQMFFNDNKPEDYED